MNSKAKPIYGERRGAAVFTKCPFGEVGRVGSTSCQKCEYFDGMVQERSDLTVMCKRELKDNIFEF